MAAFPLTVLTSEQRANFRHLYLDMLGVGIFSGSTLSFLAVYATRLGATNFQIGLLTAGPALVGLLFTLPIGRWLEDRPLIRYSFLSAFWMRLGYALLLTLPWLAGASGQVWSIVGITLAASIPGTMLQIAFNAMFMDVVPPAWRGEVVGKRNAVVSIAVVVSTLLCGQILEWVAFPLNYQIVFAIGALGAMLSSYHVARIRSAAEPLQPLISFFTRQVRPALTRLAGAAVRPAVSGGKPLLRLDVLRGPFGRIMAAYLVFYTFQYLPIPLFTPFCVRELHISDAVFSLGTAFFHLMTTLASLRAGRVSVRFSYRKISAVSAMLLCLYPLLLSLAQDATLYLVTSLIGGVVFAFVNIGLTNLLLERVPQDDRPAHMALHNLVLNLGILAGSLAGPLLGDWLGLRPALVVSVGLRFLAGLLLWRWG